MSLWRRMCGWNWGQILAPVGYAALILLIATFLHSGLQGEYGLIEQRKAEAVARQLEAELVAIRAERRRLENLVTRLSADSLDLDLLDERARAVLGYARPDELILR